MGDYLSGNIIDICSENEATKKITKHHFRDEFCERRKWITEIAIHHTTGAEYPDVEAKVLQKIFSDVGYDRGYRRIPVGYPQGGVQKFTEYRFADGYCETFSRYVSHVQPITGDVSFAMYNFICHRYKNTWRLVPLFLDALENKSGGLWQFGDDVRTISVSFCGLYLDKRIDKAAVEYLAKAFAPLRSQRGSLTFKPHRFYDPTDCPGMITEEIETLNKLIQEA